MLNLHERFLDEDLPCFIPDGKVGILATIDGGNRPHLTLITAMQALDTGHLVFGQFCDGSGKDNARARRKTGFLFMTLDKKLWRGKAIWREARKTGPEFEMFNQKPMWRYNAYFGIHTVHYLDLVGTTRRENLPMGKIVSGVIASNLLPAKPNPHTSSEVEVMNSWTRMMVSKAGVLKFLAYIDNDGYPVIVPALSCRAVATDSIVFPRAEYADEITLVPQGPVALYAMALSMETVMVKGMYTPAPRNSIIKAGILLVDQVYNSMPPVPGLIYPQQPLDPVKEFS